MTGTSSQEHAVTKAEVSPDTEDYLAVSVTCIALAKYCQNLLPSLKPKFCRPVCTWSLNNSSCYLTMLCRKILLKHNSLLTSSSALNLICTSHSAQQLHCSSSSLKKKEQYSKKALFGAIRKWHTFLRRVLAFLGNIPQSAQPIDISLPSEGKGDTPLHHPAVSQSLSTASIAETHLQSHLSQVTAAVSKHILEKIALPAKGMAH